MYTLSIWRSTFGQMYHGNHSFSTNAILLLLLQIKTMNCVNFFFLSFFFIITVVAYTFPFSNNNCNNDSLVETTTVI